MGIANKSKPDFQHSSINRSFEFVGITSLSCLVFMSFLIAGCSSDESCLASIANSMCSEGYCFCKPGYREDGNVNCVVRKLGDNGCIDEEDCSTTIANSTCVSPGICTCKDGYVPATSLDKCSLRRIGDANCIHNSDCAIKNSHCDRNSTCACDRGYDVIDMRTMCERKIIGSSCEVAIDCLSVIDNSLCTYVSTYLFVADNVLVLHMYITCGSASSP